MIGMVSLVTTKKASRKGGEDRKKCKLSEVDFNQPSD